MVHLMLLLYDMALVVIVIEVKSLSTAPYLCTAYLVDELPPMHELELLQQLGDYVDGILSPTSWELAS